MLTLIAGLWLFLGVHSLGYAAPRLRAAGIAKLGSTGWKAAYALLSLLGFVLIVHGYVEARGDTQVLYAPPVWTRHLASLLTLPAFVLLVAAYLPGTWMKARFGHPMLLGTKLWALAHLLANGMLHDVLLFGGFLGWSVYGYIICRRRDRAIGIVRNAVGWPRDLAAAVIGIALWAGFALHLHARWIGVAPFG
ncbi:MAG: NnrU family protein [Xanthomonadales bacterium]|jgi:uncharacterized membrane protein|nr:NnrU family protein [Xanthomonadales bacterium]